VVMEYHIVVPYDSYEQYKTLMQEVLQKHLGMIDTDLLCFQRQCAEYKIIDLAHDTDWREQSKAAMLTLTLNHHEQWCSSMATTLWFILKQVLGATLLFVQTDIKRRPLAQMCTISSVRRAVVETIKDFFEFEHSSGINWTTLFIDDNFDYANSDDDDDVTLVPIDKLEPERKRKRES
jgi:hypothetical protein